MKKGREGGRDVAGGRAARTRWYISLSVRGPGHVGRDGRRTWQRHVWPILFRDEAAALEVIGWPSFWRANPALPGRIVSACVRKVVLDAAGRIVTPTC